jgi:2',3'-cyclic-nucleotide 2'-phosphodiesterase (5'-nucleotidase family)
MIKEDIMFEPGFLVEVLQAAWAGGGVPILGTNLDPMGHSLGSWITPTLILEAHGVKVGFFGLTTPTGALANPSPVVIRPDINPIGQTAVNELRAAGAQVVVCVEHMGMSPARELAGDVSGIDVTVTEGVYAALKYGLGLKMQDIQNLPDLAFDAARSFVSRRGELGPAASNRIRDVAAIPGKGH